MDASRIIIEIELGNDAMQSVGEVVDSVRKALVGQASSLFDPLRPHECGAIRDGNGNTVGKWEVQ